MENKDFFWVEIKKEKIINDIFNNKNFFVEKFALDILELPTNSNINVFDKDSSFYLISKNNNNCLDFCSYISRTFSIYLISFFKGNYFIFNDEGKYIYIDSKNNFSYDSIMNIFTNLQKDGAKKCQEQKKDTITTYDTNIENFIASKLSKFDNLFKNTVPSKENEFSGKLDMNNISADKYFDLNKINYASLDNFKNITDDNLTEDDVPHINLGNYKSPDNIDLPPTKSDIFVNMNDLQKDETTKNVMNLNDDIIASWENENLNNDSNKFPIFGDSLNSTSEDNIFTKYNDSIDSKTEELSDAEILRDNFYAESNASISKSFQDSDFILNDDNDKNNNQEENDHLDIWKKNIFPNHSSDTDLNNDNLNDDTNNESINDSHISDYLDAVKNDIGLNDDTNNESINDSHINDYLDAVKNDIGLNDNLNNEPINDSHINDYLEAIKNDVGLNDEYILDNIPTQNEEIVSIPNSYETISDSNINDYLEAIKNDVGLNDDSQDLNTNNFSTEQILDSTPTFNEDIDNVSLNEKTVYETISDSHINDYLEAVKNDVDLNDDNQDLNTNNFSTEEISESVPTFNEDIDNADSDEKTNYETLNDSQIDEHLETIKNDIFPNDDDSNLNIDSLAQEDIIENNNDINEDVISTDKLYQDTENEIIEENENIDNQASSKIDDDLEILRKNIFQTNIDNLTSNENNNSTNVDQEEKPINKFDNFLNDLKKEREKLKLERDKFKDNFLRMGKMSD